MKLKDIVQKANAASGSVDNKLVQESISSYLLEFAQTFESNLTSQSADQHCQSLDDLISCQPFCAVTSNRIILERLYKRLFVACSGTAVRNSLNTVSNVLNDKISSIFCKEVALIIINTVFKIRPNECISAASSSMQILVRFTKVSESEHRKLALKGITSIVEGTGTFNVDELIRLISKLSYDKEVKVRFCCPSVLVAMIRKSSSIDYELFSSVLIKRLDESDTKVLKVVCNSLALLLLAKIKEFNLQKELQKIDKARGTANIEPDNKNKLSRLSFGKFIQKRILEDFSVLSVVDYLLQNLVKATVLGVKSAYLLVLGEIISAIGTEITQDEYYSLIINLFSILHEILPENTRFEDATVVCSKFSSVIRMIVSGPMTEAKLIDFAASLCKYLTGMESKTEYELQIILSELNSILHQLQETCAVIADDVQGAASLQLRHGSFGVRDAAAKLLVTLSCQVPFVAKDVMHSALANTRVQDKQLFNLLEEENDSSNNTNANSTDTNSLKKKANKDAEKMQRMYFFHGNTLSIAMLMKAHLSIPFGVAKANVIEIINLGLELLDRNMFDASGVGDSATCCSIVRAGSIIISSCISFGYLTVKLSIATILEACQRILRPANQIKSNNNSEDKEDKVIHEIMHVEACLVIFSSILTYCPEALVLEPDVLPIIVDGLENTFRAVKGKFQPICKENFRFCTVHVALLDCFCQLPRGSNAGSAQQVYVEALRVLRDAISSGSTCTQAIEEKSLAGTLQSSLLISWWRVAKIYEYSGPFTPSEILLDIESHSKLLQKKECEAFLVSFRRFNNNKYTSQISFLESAELNSNTVNSTISLIASTFIDQNAEYQVKTIQLCAQAIAQFVKTNAKASMFTTEEDKKKRNKKSASTSLNVITILHAIATKIPLSTDVNVLLWLANAVEILFDAISRGSIYVNYLASITLTRLGELKNSQIFDDIGGRIRSIIMQSLIKKGDTMLSIAPYSLILSLFWGSSSCNSDTKSMLLTTIFDCLQKSDCSSVYRSYGFLALSNVLDHIANFSDDNNKEVVDEEVSDIFSKAFSIMISSWASLSSTGDQELRFFELCLLRLCNRTLALGMKSQSLDDKVNTVLTIWESISQGTRDTAILSESLNIYSSTSKKRTDRNDFYFKEFNKILRKMSSYSFQSLTTAVKGIAECIKAQPNLALEAGIHLVLYQILDYSYAATAKSSMEFFGLEVDRNVLIESSTYSSRQDLQDVTQETLFLFADVSSSLSPQTFAIDWIIMARHAVMTISNANAEQLMEEENEGVEESQSALATREKLNSSTIYNFQVFKENLDRSANDSTLLNKFVTFVKEKNRMNASCFEGTSRTQLKWVAVKCARIALQNVVVRLGDIDIFAGKGLTVEAIKSALARDSSEEFYNTPKFLSVFLSEIINLACAGTTFTMNDKPVRALQYESLLIIEKIVNELINSRDPDVAESDKIAESKILHPYLSQLLSSVKLCVAAPWYANMRLPAAAVVANLIKGSFIADKIILRRTLKSFTTHWGASGESERLDISCRPKETLHASEESNLADHVALSISVAMVYISTYSSSEISESFQANITGMLNDIGNLEKLWFGIMQDLLRVKLIMSAVHANGDLSPLTTALTTKALSPAIHPQRGGQVFLPGMLSKDVVPQYFHNLPKLMYAYLLLKAKTVKAEEVKTLWSMNTLLIYIEVDLFKKNWKEKNIGDLKCLLLILIQLGKEPSFSIIGIDPWIDVLTTLESIIVDKVKNKSPGWNNLLVSLLQLEMTLIGRLEIIDVKKDKRMEEKVKKYWFVLWITLLASLHAYYPIIFNSIEFNHSTMYEKSVAKIALCTPNAILQAAINSELVEKSRIIFLQSFGKVLLKMVTYNRQVGLYALDLLLALASAEICFSTDSTPSIPLSESIFNLLLETISNVYRVLDDDGRLSFNKSNDKMMLAMIKDTDNAKKVSVYDKISQMALHIIGLAGTSGTKTSTCELRFIPEIILPDNPSNFKVSKQFLFTSLKFVQQNNNTAVGKTVGISLLPALLTRLCTSLDDSESILIVVRLLLIIFNTMGGEYHAKVLELMLQPWCYSISTHANDENYNLFSGKAITQLARLLPEQFRTEVGKLPEDMKTILQGVMRRALQESAADNSSTAGTQPALKLNVEKFRSSGK